MIPRPATFVALNHGTAPRRIRVLWPGARFAELERTGPRQPNSVEPAPRPAQAARSR